MIVPIMKTVNHIVHLRLKEKPLPNSMSSGRIKPAAYLSRSVEYEYMKKDAESLFKKGLRIAYF